MNNKRTKNITDTEPAARLIAIMFIIGIAGMLIFGRITLVSGLFIIRIHIGFAVILNFIPKKIYPFIYQIRPKLRILFNIAGLAPIVTVVILALNYFITIESHEQAYKVIHTIYFDHDDHFELLLDGDALGIHDQIRRFDKKDYIGIHDSVLYTFSKGIFGITVIKDSKIIMKYED